MMGKNREGDFLILPIYLALTNIIPPPSFHFNIEKEENMIVKDQKLYWK
jgi:hypothetical protein